jgi:hypothetical protein
MKRWLIFLLIVTQLSCEKENNNEPQIKFEGITERDIYGYPYGNIDSTDWQIGENWQDLEKQLFQDFNSYNYKDSNDANFEIIAYPNPFEVSIYLRLTKKNTTRFDFRVVTQEFNIIISKDSIINNEIYINISDFLNPRDTILRIYYRFIEENNFGYLGHGDLLNKNE